MKNTSIFVLSLAAAGLAASCGYTAPYQNSGPALSQEGVKIALVGERCYVNRSGEQYPTTIVDDELHVGVDLKVTNQSDQVATLALENFQLEETAGGEHAVMHPQESGSVALSPGQSTDVALDFADKAELDCHHDLKLDSQGAIAIQGRPASLASIHFQPSR